MSEILMDYAPVASVDNAAYAVMATRLVKLGSAARANNVSVNGNRLDATSSNTGAVFIRVAGYCGCIDNEVRSTSPSTLVMLSADHVGANNNRLMNRGGDMDILLIEARGYVLMGNMLTGMITVIENGTSGRPPEPWKSLNIFI
jgi:hypothetical protein